MEIVDLENRVKEIDMSVFQMKELIKNTEEEANQYLKQKQDMIGNTNRSIFENEGRKKELQKLIVDFKKEETEGVKSDATTGN